MRKAITSRLYRIPSTIVVLFNLLLILTPLIFYPKTSEVFEFNKMVLTYAFTTAISGIWVIRMIIEKKFLFRRTILDIPLLLFLGSQIISTLLSIDQRTSLLGYYSRFNGGLLSTISYILLYWAYVSNLNKNDTLFIIRNTLFTALIVSIYGILEHMGHSPSCLILTGSFDVDCWVQDVRTRVFATLGQPNWMAAYLVALVPLSWKLSFTKSKFWKIVSVALFAAILFTKSRSGILGLLVALAIFVLAKLFTKNKKDIALLIASIVAITAIFGTPWTPSLLGTKPEGARLPALEAAGNSGQGTESGDIRKIVWKGAFGIFKAYPIFGTGPETFAYSYYQFRPTEHNLVSEWDFLYNKAHNEYLNYLANTGIVGLGSYLILIIFSVYQIYKSKRFELLAGYFSLLVTNFFGFSVVVTQILLFLFPAMAVTWKNSQSHKK